MSTQAPSISLLTAVAREYAVDLDWLLRGTGQAKPSPHTLVQTNELTIASVLDELGRRLERLEDALMTPPPAHEPQAEFRVAQIEVGTAAVSGSARRA